MPHSDIQTLLDESEERERLDNEKIKELAKNNATLKKKLKMLAATIKTLEADNPLTGAVDLTRQTELQDELTRVKSQFKDQTSVATTALSNLEDVENDLRAAHDVLAEQENEIHTLQNSAKSSWVNIGSCQFRTTDPALHL